MVEELMDVSTDSAAYRRNHEDPDDVFQLASDILVYNNKINLSHLIDDQKQIRKYEIKEPIGFAILLGSDRNGTEEPTTCVHHDLTLMARSLKACPGKWKISSPCIKEGSHDVILTCDRLHEIIEDLKNSPTHLAPYSCFLFYYSGHGISSGVVLCDGNVVSYKSIVESLCIQALKDKPKIFVFDSCRHDSDIENYEKAGEWSSDMGFEGKSGIPFHKHIDLKFQEEKKQGYPPENTGIYFSAADGMPGFGYEGIGSIYTLQLSHALPQFCYALSFCEIMTQVNGMTVRISQLRLNDDKEKNRRVQQPVCYSTLNKLLILSASGLAHAAAATGRSHDGAFGTIKPLATGEVELDKGVEQKGPYPPQKQLQSPDRDARAGSPVMTDRVQRRRRVFHSKEEVQSYLPELGEGVSVFICYAPDPESPYLDPQRRGAEIRRNEKLITMLTADLEQHGFHVVSDLHLGDTEPRNWLRWYISRIHLCDFIILVCSPAFDELFSRETLRQDVVDQRAVMFRTYSQAIYDEIAQDVTRGNNTSKFIPVILDRAWEGRDSVPSLFRGGFVYNLSGGSVPRRFVYGNRDGGFERLVCRMAGINRVELDKPRDRMLHMLPKPDERGPVGYMNTEKFLQANSKPRTGYKTVPSSIGQPTASRPAPSPWDTWKQNTPRYQPVPSSYQQQYSAATVPKQTGMIPLAHPLAHPQPHPPTTVAASAPPSAIQSQPSYDPTLLPNKPPHQSVILWLSERIVKWKFIARFLGLEEFEIDRIVEENPRDIKEQCYLMFRKWEQQMPDKYSYQTLGKVLLDSEKNKRLFADFAKEVSKAEEKE